MCCQAVLVSSCSIGVVCVRRKSLRVISSQCDAFRFLMVRSFSLSPIKKMDQPSSLKTLFRLGGEPVTAATHVCVYCSAADAGSHEAAKALSDAMGQLSTHQTKLQLVPEATYLASLAAHAAPTNDGAPVRTPFVIGRCEKLTKQLGWAEMDEPGKKDTVAAAAAATAD